MFQEDAMAKSQKRSSREVKKPKKNKDTAKDPASLSRGVSAASAPPKRKG